MKKSIIVILLFALSNLSCGILGWSTLTIHNNCTTGIYVTCSYSWQSEEDEYGYAETNYEYWTLDLTDGESVSETIYGDTGTRIYLRAQQGSKTADFSYNVSVNGDKTVNIYNTDF